ncbi:MAG: helix-turn-helix domain-containing protein [Rhodobacteraceae bacterium]|nr:helix-turn-helix domain-containing protein [Paracoccaceae bacterium]
MANANNSLAKMLAILDAFSVDRHIWTVDALATHFGYTQPSTYRYVRELCEAGLIVRMPGGKYAIGARAVELDSLIAETDPLTKVFSPMMESFSRTLGCTTLLSNAYGEHLINIKHFGGNEMLDLTFLRGRRLPWFRGATSTAILAFLPRARVRRLFDQYYEGEKSKENWKKELTKLNQIADSGFSVSQGELQETIVGIGCPIIVNGDVLGSVTLVFSRTHAAFLDHQATGTALREKTLECETLLDNEASVDRAGE